MPVPTMPSTATAATGPRAGARVGAPIAATGARSTVAATQAHAAPPIAGRPASRCFTVNAPIA